ncbi:hypothetical protein AOC05_04940 [Arthrobacter alpinus]|uniref:Major tail protein n=1 Tax=Arthrobacter alpinus TaxID=656366 RepID=A0A0M3UFY3_9MICC|nr:hypothetical protein [Arthrobacter alpinus]ALE91819.1 hypothetical protein AOC05_04940 [Arthrobacter alpinus]
MATPGPKMLTDDNLRLVWVPTIANYHAPTVTELTAGIDLSCLITAADYALGATGDDSIADPAMCDSTNSSVPGRTTFEAAMNFFRFTDTLDDVAWTTFSGKGIHGYLVERLGHAVGVKAHEVTWKAADKVSVYEVITNTPQKLSPSTAGYVKFRQVFSPQSNIDERAVVAAP